MARAAAALRGVNSAQTGPPAALLGPPPDQLVPLELSLLPPSLCTAFGVVNSPPQAIGMPPLPQHSTQQRPQQVSVGTMPRPPASQLLTRAAC